LSMVKQETYLRAGIGDQKYWRPCGAFFMCGSPWETHVQGVGSEHSIFDREVGPAIL
jgi:hypothetical protein